MLFLFDFNFTTRIAFLQQKFLQSAKENSKQLNGPTRALRLTLHVLRLMPTVIRVENLSKYYRLGLIGGKTLHDDLNRWWARVRKQPDPLLKIGQEDRQNGNSEYLWALRDINFEVQQGEIVGIIGRNGAGKSTLLKILSRITAPTSGQVKVKGRIASLLEVGTGFHPELTGRENIYLNGAILGMKKAEIDRKFDEIVAFAEVEKFIDTPVKRYSSGMYVRLAFAVAAYLDPEILIVDEVLAVGDAAFQKKCLGKMGEVSSSEGRTVLFVSHQMRAINQLCSRGLYLRKGQVLSFGLATSIVNDYLRESMAYSLGTGISDLREAHRAGGNSNVRFERVSLHRLDGSATALFSYGEPVELRLHYQSMVHRERIVFGFTLRTSDEVTLQTSASDDEGNHFMLKPGRFIVSVLIKPNFLRTGLYTLQVGCTANESEVCDVITDAIRFEISDIKPYSQTSISGLPGVIHVPYHWNAPKTYD